MVKVEVCDPEIEVGLRLTPGPPGDTEAPRLMLELKPPLGVKEIVAVVELPCTTETELGEAYSAKPGDVEPDPASALISAAPLGLPHPVTRS